MPEPKNPLDAVKKSKRANAEIYGPFLTQHAMGDLELSNADRDELMGYHERREDNKVKRWLTRLNGDGSDNVPLIDAMLQLWLRGRRENEIVEQWKHFFDLQAGRVAPQQGENRLAYFFIDEPYSANYGGWHLGCFVNVAEWARRNGRPGLESKAKQHIEQVVMKFALISLKMPKGAPEGIAINARGERYDSGTIFTPPVGQRSNTAHLDSGIRLMLENLIKRRAVEMRRRADWFVFGTQKYQPEINTAEAARFLENPRLETAKALADVATFRIQGTERVRDWGDVHAVSLDDWINKNTTAVLLWMTDRQTGRYRMGFPFEEGRGFGLGGGAYCKYQPQESRFVVSSDYVKEPLVFDAPKRKPTFHIVVDSQGVRVD
jgi:hypothetical protein